MSTVSYVQQVNISHNCCELSVMQLLLSQKDQPLDQDDVLLHWENRKGMRISYDGKELSLSFNMGYLTVFITEEYTKELIILTE